ncbi:uncharacterized protein BT62DRAFT_923167 [Guyanagaster necrorhizus]|uniref:Uncharacterized protein n=1 Tax=Guyanagaster necrorhizus TaxID=856835 RepID=A0A9P8AMZ6_9AGAR|nr:uncharacterized protein BT62DRAFT_923167 [Guyanagaster necrorhizus MCA 3950]KAG7441768.1 hypothetical protein BT62DRAFT_923167 [Guyanagaster necrorhizus MCA 3950]
MSGHMPALQNVEEWGDREDEEEIMAIIEREEREKQKEMDMQEREDRILRECREEEDSLEDEAEPDIRRQIMDEREPITMEGNRGMLLGEPIVSPSRAILTPTDEKQPAKKIGHVPRTAHTLICNVLWTFLKYKNGHISRIGNVLQTFLKHKNGHISRTGNVPRTVHATYANSKTQEWSYFENRSCTAKQMCSLCPCHVQMGIDFMYHETDMPPTKAHGPCTRGTASEASIAFRSPTTAVLCTAVALNPNFGLLLRFF